MENLNILIKRKNELNRTIQEIDMLAAESTAKVLDAIDRQRWFFFDETSQIIFDRETGLIWANLDHFPWKKDDEEQLVYSDENDYKEVTELLEEMNYQNFGGYGSWKIPTHIELWKLVEDKSFPFCEGNNWNIKKRCYWCVSYKNNIASKDLDDSPADADIKSNHSVFVIPCSHEFITENFSGTAKEILEIFDKNNLIPKFDDEEISKIYRKIFVEKVMARRQAVLNQILEIDQKIEEIENEEPITTVNFDYKDLLEKFNIAEIEKSPIKYYKAVFDLSYDLSKVIYEYAYTHKKIINEFTNAAMKLDNQYVECDKLTAEENSFLEERQKFLARHLKPGIEEVSKQISAVKAQAEDFNARIEKINNGSNSIKEFAELEKEPRVSFEFLIENLGNLIIDAQKRVDFFIAHKNFVAEIMNQWEIWSEDYKSFGTNLCEDFMRICQKDGIDKNLSQKWAGEWRNKRFIIEERFLPLIEYCLFGNLLDGNGAEALKLLQVYKEDIDKFYLNDRKNIHKKFFSASDGGFREQLEIGSAIRRFNAKFHHELKKIIFDCRREDEKHFLLIWARPFSTMPIDIIMNFVSEKNFEKVPPKILRQFEELRNRNLTDYLSDSQAYTAAIEKYKNDFDNLIKEVQKFF